MRHQCNLVAKESGLECTCVNNDDFTVLVSGGGRCHWVSMCTVWPSHSRWLNEYSNKSASKFALSFNIPPQKLSGWFKRLQLWATGDWQLHHDNGPPHASRLMQFFWKNIKSPSWLSPPIAQIWCPGTFGFFKTNTTFDREEISDHQWDSEKYDGAADGDWENCVRSQGAYFEGDWGVIVLCTVFLLSCVFFSKYLYFSYYMAGDLLDRPCIYIYIYTHMYTYMIEIII